MSELYRQSGRHRSAKSVPTFADRGVSHGQRNGSPRPFLISFSRPEPLLFIHVAPQLTSRGWVDPVPDPLLLRKSGSAGNRTRDLCICSQKLWPLDYRGSLLFTILILNRIGLCLWAGRAQSVERLATGWTVRGSSSGGGGERYSPPVQTDPETHPASTTIGTGSFPGVKRPGRGDNHPTHLAPKLKKEYGYTFTPPLGSRGLFYGELILCMYKEKDPEHIWFCMFSLKQTCPYHTNIQDNYGCRCCGWLE